MGIRRLQLTNNIEQNTNYDKYRRWQANEQSKVGGNLRILLPYVRCALCVLFAKTKPHISRNDAQWATMAPLGSSYRIRCNK